LNENSLRTSLGYVKKGELLNITLEFGYRSRYNDKKTIRHDLAPNVTVFINDKLNDKIKFTYLSPLNQHSNLELLNITVDVIKKMNHIIIASSYHHCECLHNKRKKC
jgi:hypothetical protein